MFDVEKFIRMVEERPALYDPRSQGYGSRDVKSQCWWEIGSQVCENWDTLNVREKYDKEKELLRKWKAIRDNFVKDIRHNKKLMTGEGIPKRRRYIYHSAMQFLLPIIDDGEDSERPTVDRKANRRESRPRTRIRSTRVKISAITSTTAYKRDDVIRNEEGIIKEEPCIIKEEPCDAVTITTNDIKSISTNFTSVSNVSNVANAPKNNSQNEGNEDIYGNRAFLLSYLPIMDDLPSDLALEARLKITEVFRNICAESVTRRSLHSDSDHDLILPEPLVELVDSPSDNVSLDIDLSN